MFFIPENLILIIYTQPGPHLNKKQKRNMTKKKQRQVIQKQLLGVHIDVKNCYKAVDGWHDVFLLNPKLWSYASTACSMSPAQVTVRRITSIEWVVPTSARSRSRVGSCAFHCHSGLGGYQSKYCWEGNVRSVWPAVLNDWVCFEYACLWSGLH